MQDYTQEFRKRSLMLGVDLQSQDTLLNYIGGLHSYLRHNILMFSPTSLDEVCVQATYLEARGKNIPEEGKRSHLRVERNERVSKGKERKMHPLRTKERK